MIFFRLKRKNKLRKLNKHIREIHKVYVNLSSYVEPMHIFGSRNIDNAIPKEKLPSSNSEDHPNFSNVRTALKRNISEELELGKTDPNEKIPTRIRVIDNYSILQITEKFDAATSIIKNDDDDEKNIDFWHESEKINQIENEETNEEHIDQLSQSLESVKLSDASMYTQARPGL